jgi:hypothetical protein
LRRAKGIGDALGNLGWCVRGALSMILGFVAEFLGLAPGLAFEAGFVMA